MPKLPNCPKCNSEYTYEDGYMLVCPECFHEWTLEEEEAVDAVEEVEEVLIRDAHGTVLQDGDDVTVVKDLKVKGSSDPLKQGTKISNIKLVENPSDGHDIDCRIQGFGAMKLKSEFLKKL